MLPHFRVACRSVELVGDVKLYEVASINNPTYRIELSIQPCVQKAVCHLVERFVFDLRCKL